MAGLMINGSMIQGLVYNGNPVSAMYNGQLIWPTAEPTPTGSKLIYLSNMTRGSNGYLNTDVNLCGISSIYFSTNAWQSSSYAYNTQISSTPTGTQGLYNLPSGYIGKTCVAIGSNGMYYDNYAARHMMIPNTIKEFTVGWWYFSWGDMPIFGGMAGPKTNYKPGNYKYGYLWNGNNLTANNASNTISSDVLTEWQNSSASYLKIACENTEFNSAWHYISYYVDAKSSPYKMEMYVDGQRKFTFETSSTAFSALNFSQWKCAMNSFYQIGFGEGSRNFRLIDLNVYEGKHVDVPSAPISAD